MRKFLRTIWARVLLGWRSVERKGRLLEARVGFEPTNGGFADLSLRPLGYRAEVKEYSETGIQLSVAAWSRRFEIRWESQDGFTLNYSGLAIGKRNPDFQRIDRSESCAALNATARA